MSEVTFYAYADVPAHGIRMGQRAAVDEGLAEELAAKRLGEVLQGEAAEPKGDERATLIRNAAGALAEGERTADGRFKVEALSRAAGFKVTAEERDAVLGVPEG